MWILLSLQVPTGRPLPPPGVEWPSELEEFMFQLLFKETSIPVPRGCGFDLCPYQEVSTGAFGCSIACVELYIHVLKFVVAG